MYLYVLGVSEVTTSSVSCRCIYVLGVSEVTTSSVSCRYICKC